MTHQLGYDEVMARRPGIMRRSIGLDYKQYETGALSFDYERLLADTGYDLEAVKAIQARTAVGSTRWSWDYAGVDTSFYQRDIGWK